MPNLTEWPHLVGKSGVVERGKVERLGRAPERQRKEVSMPPLNNSRRIYSSEDLIKLSTWEMAGLQGVRPL